jgi:hypothetical protein
MAAVVAGLCVAAPSRAAELDKYLPESTTAYVHIKTKNIFTSDLVRKLVPQVFDKYGDQMVALVQLAKQFNPQAPAIPEEQLKEGIAQLKKPEVIAQGFDVAKEFAPDIVIAGDDANPDAFLVLIKTDEGVTPEMVEGFVPLINLQGGGQMKIKKVNKGEGAVFEMTMAQGPKFYFAMPAAGVIAIGGQQKSIEAAVAAKEAKVNPELKKMIEKRDPKDFIFAAGLKGKGAEAESFVASLVLDKDLTGKMTGTAATEEKAKEMAAKANEGIGEAAGQITGALGDAGMGLKGEIEKFKARAEGKNVILEGKITGESVLKLLKD